MREGVRGGHVGAHTSLDLQIVTVIANRMLRYSKKFVEFPAIEALLCESISIREGRQWRSYVKKHSGATAELSNNRKTGRQQTRNF